MATMDNFAIVKAEVADALWQDWYAWKNAKPDYDRLRFKLRELRKVLDPIS